MEYKKDKMEKTQSLDRVNQYGKNSLRIGITGMGEKAGASFVTMLLAEALAAANSSEDTPVTVFSAGDSYYFDALGMDSRFAGNEFIPVENLAEANVFSKAVNVSERISWAVSAPKSFGKNLSLAEQLRILYRLKGEIVLWDIKYKNFRTDYREILKNLDALVFVIDPLPSRMLGSYELFARIKEIEKPVIFIINKMNNGVNKHELAGLLKLKKPVIIPFADSQGIYASEYSCENPYRSLHIRKSVIEPVGQISEIIGDIQKYYLL